MSRIFPFNTASLGLCRSLGFREVGTYEKHGRLDGRWLDVVVVERLIPENQPWTAASFSMDLRLQEGRSRVKEPMIASSEANKD